MPLYEFRCEDCGVFELWRSIVEATAPAHCPDCEVVGRRIFSPPALLSGSLRLKQEQREPHLVQRDREPKTPRVRQHSGSRPWMIGHG